MAAAFSDKTGCWCLLRAAAVSVIMPAVQGLTLTGCDTLLPRTAAITQDTAFFDHSAYPVALLTGVRLNVASQIVTPVHIRRANGLLWVRDHAARPWFHLVNPENGEILSSTGRRGEGHGEFASVSNFGETQDTPPRVWVFDPVLQRVTFYGGPSAGDFEVEFVPLNNPVPHGGGLLIDAGAGARAVWANTDRLILVTRSAVGRFNMFGRDGQKIKTISGELLGPDVAPEFQRSLASYSLIALCERPAAVGGFVIAYGSAGRVDLHDADAKRIGSFEAPYPSEPFFVEDPQTGSLLHQHRRTWYLDCYGTSQHLFALFSGRRSLTYSVPERDSGEFVHVFGWDGSLQRVLRLDRAVRSITVDPSTNTLYATSMLDGGVYRFTLPD